MMGIKMKVRQMHENELSLEESLFNCRFYFEASLRLLLGSTSDLYTEYGESLNASWEARQELLSGESLIGWDKISLEDQGKIKKIVEKAKSMESEAFSGKGQADFSHPDWEQVRDLARNYLGRC